MQKTDTKEIQKQVQVSRKGDPLGIVQNIEITAF